MVKPLRMRWLTAASNAGMFTFGVVMAVLGAILPLISERLGFDLSQAGNLFLAMNLAMLVSMGAIGPLMDRYGKKPPMVAGPLFVCGALWLIMTAGAFSGLMAGFALLGFGGGLLNSATNTLIADLHSDPARKNSALNLLGVYFGIGAIFLPFTIGALLHAVGLAAILYVTMALALVPLAISAALPFPPPRHEQRVPLREAARLARNPLVLAFALLLFFESGNEFIIGGYTAEYLKRDLAASVRAAEFLLAIYWASVIAGRVLFSRLLLRWKGPAVVMGSALAAACGLGLLAAAQGQAVAAIALVLVGVGVSSIFPTTLGLAGSRFEEYSGTVFGILFAIALTGGISLPWSLGHLAAASGLRSALLLPIGGFVAIFAMQCLISRMPASTTGAARDQRL